MFGENPPTVSPVWERDRGRVEGEGEQERVYMITILLSDAGGAGQEKITSLTPGVAVNPSGPSYGTASIRKNTQPLSYQIFQ